MHTTWETHPNGQDHSSLLLGGGALQPLIGCLDLQTNYEQVIYLQGTHDLELSCTSNATKSCTMQKMLGENAHKV